VPAFVPALVPALEPSLIAPPGPDKSPDGVSE